MMSAATASDRLRSAPRMAACALWSGSTWRATSHVVTGMVIGLVGLLLVLILMVLTLALAPTVIGAAVALALLLVLNRGLTSVQRSRFEAFLELQIPRALSSQPAEPLVRRMVRDLQDAGTWRQLGYHILAGVFGVLAGLVLTAVWSAGATLTPAVFYGPVFGGDDLAVSIGLTLAGLILLFTAPWVARAIAMADAAMVRPLLGTDSTEELARRVEVLTASREGVVDAADTERRRIERDLHDGAQQRLTSLAVNLGIARTNLTDASEPARTVIAQAHDEAKQALADLRELVRGMHPAVLDDRGLDAALSGIAARSPVPVRLRVAMPARAARDVEAVAYFVVSETLTNATSHAGASQVDVTIERRDDRLHVTVTDDGRGGADPDRGTGLHGLINWVRSVDGTLQIDSPDGGPTKVVVELPCGL